MLSTYIRSRSSRQGVHQQARQSVGSPCQHLLKCSPFAEHCSPPHKLAIIHTAQSPRPIRSRSAVCAKSRWSIPIHAARRCYAPRRRGQQRCLRVASSGYHKWYTIRNPTLRYRHKEHNASSEVPFLSGVSASISNATMARLSAKKDNNKPPTSPVKKRPRKGRLTARFIDQQPIQHTDQRAGREPVILFDATTKQKAAELSPTITITTTATSSSLSSSLSSLSDHDVASTVSLSPSSLASPPPKSIYMWIEPALARDNLTTKPPATLGSARTRKRSVKDADDVEAPPMKRSKTNGRIVNTTKSPVNVPADQSTLQATNIESETNELQKAAEEQRMFHQKYRQLVKESAMRSTLPQNHMLSEAITSSKHKAVSGQNVSFQGTDPLFVVAKKPRLEMITELPQREDASSQTNKTRAQINSITQREKAGQTSNKALDKQKILQQCCHIGNYSPVEGVTVCTSRCNSHWSWVNDSKIVMHGSDTHSRSTSAQMTESIARGAKTNGRGSARGGARGGRGNSGSGRGRGGRGRGRGREEDSPEPPKRTPNQEDAIIIKHAKARQAELRRIFSVVGSQQAELLDALAARDLNRLAKKSKAHKQVPEYEDMTEQLDEQKALAQELVRLRTETAEDAERRRYAAEKEAIEARCNIKVTDLQEEYKRGAQGDLIIFRRAVAAAHDETRTQDGSEIDYLPQYHDFPEPDQSVRGYTATHITDEKPFKHHLLTYDDQARREVIDDDVGPIIQAFAQKNAERRAEEQRKKTQTMEALSAEAEKQIKEIQEQMTPKPPRREEHANSFALSCLADVSEWVTYQDPRKPHVYVPPERGEVFYRDRPSYDRLPVRNTAIPPPPHQSEVAAPLQQALTVKGPLPIGQPTQPTQPNQPPQSTQPTRRSLRNLQPNGPVGQNQSQPSTPLNSTPAPPAPVIATGSGPALAPAPPKLAPASSVSQAQHKPAPIDTRPHITSPPDRSPIQPQPTQQQAQNGHALPPLQPRHMSQGSLTQPPQYPYPQQYSPTHQSPKYPPPLHPTSGPAQHQPVPPPAPSPYIHQQQSIPPPSPYGHHLPGPYSPYGQQFYPYPGPPPQQQYSFMPPQQGPVSAVQGSPAPRIHSRTKSTASSQGPLPPAPLPINQHQSKPQPHDQYHTPPQNGYHGRSISHSYPPPPQPAPQTQPAPPVPVPPHTTSTAKSRARAKAKQPVTFVNQTLATRKAAAEQLAKEEAAAAAEKKDRDKDKAKANDKGRKLAPKP